MNQNNSMLEQARALISMLLEPSPTSLTVEGFNQPLSYTLLQYHQVNGLALRLNDLIALEPKRAKLRAITSVGEVELNLVLERSFRNGKDYLFSVESSRQISEDAFTLLKSGAKIDITVPPLKILTDESTQSPISHQLIGYSQDWIMLQSLYKGQETDLSKECEILTPRGIAIALDANEIPRAYGDNVLLKALSTGDLKAEYAHMQVTQAEAKKLITDAQNRGVI